jgi:hypothetical protein
MPSKTIEEQRVKLDEGKQRHADKITHQERKLSLKELILKWKETFMDATNPADAEKKRKWMEAQRADVPRSV